MCLRLFFIYLLYVVNCNVCNVSCELHLHASFTLFTQILRLTMPLSDTEIIDYYDNSFEMHALPPAPNSVLFSTQGRGNNLESLQEMEAANNLNVIQRSQPSQPFRQPFHRSFSQPLTSWSGSIVCFEYF